MRVCVIGMGPIGNLHAKIYSQNEDSTLCGVCDIIPERAEAAGSRFKVPWYTDAREMIREQKPFLCSIATGGYEYSSDHFKPAMQAFDAGCHVFLEKPISNEIEAAEKMVEYAKEKGLCFAIDFNHRFTPAARTAKKWQEQGLIGEILFANMALWIGKFQKLDSEYYHIKALNPHSIDILRYFCGDIKKVHCFAYKAPGRDLWSTASINLKFESGAVGHLTSSYDIERGHPMERCEIAGTRGRFVIDDIWREATLYPAGEKEKRVYTNPIFGGFGSFEDTFAERIGCYLKQLKEGAAPGEIDGSGEAGLKAQQVIQAAIDSLRSGNAVEL